MSDDLLSVEHLAKLAAALNAFKSEAIQLRILEAMLAQRKYDLPDSILSGASQHERSSSRKLKSNRKDTAAVRTRTPPKRGKANGKAAAGDGAIASLNRLTESDFFSKPKTISDIIDYCKQNFARTFKSNEFSGRLGRLVRNSSLTRKKNSDGQYEYTKK